MTNAQHTPIVERLLHTQADIYGNFDGEHDDWADLFGQAADIITDLLAALEKIASVDMGGGYLGAKACRDLARTAISRARSEGR